MRKFLLALVALIGISGGLSIAANYTMTQGAGTTFGSAVVAGVNYAQQFICDATTPSQCAAVSAAGAQKVDGSAVTQPVSAASLPLPTGAATAAKQPALGTAGSASSDVLTVQGIASMTPFLANPGTPASWGINSLGSTTSGQSGELALGAVTTAAPTYTTGQSNALSLTTGGALRVDASASTQPVSGTVAATQSGTWTVQPGNTANTTAWLVTGTGGTFPATQSGTWNVNNISGTVSLPTGASTAAKQPALGTAGSASSDVITVQGIASMTPFLVAQSGSWTNTVVQATGSNLHMVCDSGCSGSGGTSSSFGSAFPAAGTAIGAKDSTGTNMAALNLDASGFLKVNVAAGGGSGGTSSTFGSAFPGTGTASGYTDGTNMVAGRVAASGADGVSNTTTQIFSAGFNYIYNGTTWDRVRGTSGAMNMAGTGTAGSAAGGVLTVQGVASMTPFLVNPGTAANWGVVAQGSTTSGQSGNLAQGAVTTSAPTYTTAQTSPLSLDTSGSLRVNVTSATGVAQGSTTSGQTMSLIGGAVTTSAPTYTTAQSSPISLDTSGNVRVNCASGCSSGSVSNASSGVATSSTNSGAVAWLYGFNGTTWDQLQVDASKFLKVNISAGTVAATQSGTWNVTNISGTVSLPTGASTSALQPTNAAQGSTTSGQTGHLMEGAVTTAAPTYTTGQTNPLSLDTTGALRVNVTAGGGSGGTSSTFGAAFPGTGTATGFTDGTNMVAGKVIASGADGTSNTNTELLTGSFNYGYNGTTWDRLRTGTTTGSLLINGAGTAGTASGGVLTVQGVASMTKLLVTPDSVALPANQSVNVSQVNGVTTLTGTGAVGTGAQRIAVGTDTATIAGSAPGTAGSASSNVLTVQGVASMTPVAGNITQVLGSALSATNGLYSNILQGNAALTTANPIFDRVVAGATGGSTTAGAIVPNNTTAVVVKGSAGTLLGVQVYGIGSAPAYIKFYNATSATCGSGTPVKRLMIPAASTAANGAGSNITFGDAGVNFGTGITYCVTTGITDADTTAPAANTFLVNVDYQ